MPRPAKFYDSFHRQVYDSLTPELLDFRQQQNRDQHRQAYATLTHEQLAVRQQQDRDQHRQAYADLTPEQLEVRQQQEKIWSLVMDFLSVKESDRKHR